MGMANADRNGRAAEAHGQPRGKAGSPHSTQSSHPCGPYAEPPERPLKSKAHFKGFWIIHSSGACRITCSVVGLLLRRKRRAFEHPAARPRTRLQQLPAAPFPPQYRGMQRAQPSIGAERFAQHPQGNKAFEIYRFLNGLYGFSISFAC